MKYKYSTCLNLESLHIKPNLIDKQFIVVSHPGGFGTEIQIKRLIMAKEKENYF